MSNLILLPTNVTHSNMLEELFSVEFQGKEIWIPKYFQYDGGSIPSAAVAHDWLLSSPGETRTHADYISPE